MPQSIMKEKARQELEATGCRSQERTEMSRPMLHVSQRVTQLAFSRVQCPVLRMGPAGSDRQSRQSLTDVRLDQPDLQRSAIETLFPGDSRL